MPLTTMFGDDIGDLKMDPQDYPNTLYRVHLEGRSATLWDPNIGFRCRARGYINICNYYQLSTALEDHLDWYSEEPSHLISTFSSRRRALYWAGKQIRRHPDANAYLMKIDPQKILNVAGEPIPILQVSHIIREYPEMLPDGIQEDWVNDEFLVLYKIPRGAIVSVKPI
ncbi:hypothetical protein TWF696_008751 [Orbilia brochopaga]|uniref:DUF7587 domain-containing protein n=1 Tax=Orbilia brochopaga TaxID=3140254 RepID=A0AAV9UH12_9PEZI